MVLVTGGRRFGPQSHVWETLDALYRRDPELCIVQGGASGADAHARRWAKARGVPCITMEAAWDALGKAAGAIRNGWMLEYVEVEYCVAFPGGYGTADMKRQCKERGVKVYEA